MNQRATQPQLLLHATRELASRARQKRIQSRAACQIVNPAAALGGIVPKQTAKKLQVLFHRQGGVQIFAQPLGHIGNARANLIAMAFICHIAAQYLNVAFLNHACTGQQGQQAGLAHTIRTNQSDHASGRNIQA